MDSNRYDRQIRLKEWGRAGQEKLAKAHIAIVGCGGLGTIAAPYLAGAGVGELTLIDGDRPDVSNVHRQVVYSGKEEVTKAQALADHIHKINPSVSTTVVPQMLDKQNIEEVLMAADLVMECSDSILCKYLVNDFCHLENIPLIYGAIHRYEGYVSFFKNDSEESIHLRDIFPTPDLDIPTCSEIGVMNIIAGIIGLLQANEAIKHILQIGELLQGQLLTYNCLNSEQYKLKLSKNWTQDIEQLYDSMEYTPLSCGLIPEISSKELIDNIEDYELISILDASEHISIHPSVERIDLSRLTPNFLKSKEKKVILYCRTGRKSSMLISNLLKEDASLEVYNLKGGLMRHQRFINN
jgi:adenylyltransferase/sulfurtransferase